MNIYSLRSPRWSVLHCNEGIICKHECDIFIMLVHHVINYWSINYLHSKQDINSHHDKHDSGLKDSSITDGLTNTCVCLMVSLPWVMASLCLFSSANLIAQEIKRNKSQTPNPITSVFAFQPGKVTQTRLPVGVKFSKRLLCAEFFKKETEREIKPPNSVKVGYFWQSSQRGSAFHIPTGARRLHTSVGINKRHQNCLLRL